MRQAVAEQHSPGTNQSRFLHRNRDSPIDRAHGADIRYVQGLLGHKSVQTTVRYTYELVENLRRRYLRGHPRENETRREVDGAYREAFASFIGQLGKAKRKREQRAVELKGLTK